MKHGYSVTWKILKTEFWDWLKMAYLIWKCTVSWADTNHRYVVKSCSVRDRSWRQVTFTWFGHNYGIHLQNQESSFSTVDVALVKPKGKIAKNTYRCSKILLQWKFQIDLTNLTLKQTISENDFTIRFWNFKAEISKFLLENLIF